MTSGGNRKPANDLETSGANARQRFTAPRSPTRARSANATFLKELWMSRAAAWRAVTALTWGLITTLAVSRRAGTNRAGRWMGVFGVVGLLQSAVCGAAVREARCQTFLRRAGAAWS